MSARATGRWALTALLAALPAAWLLAGCSAAYGTRDRLQSPACGTVAAERGRAELDQAIALIADLKYDRAAGILADLTRWLASQPDDPRMPEALFWLGYCREQTDRTDEARRLYLRVTGEFPDSESARLARVRLESL